MNVNRKKRFMDEANKRRIMPTDFDRISELQSILSSYDYHSFRGQVIKDNRFSGLERHPDLILNYKGETTIIELDSGVHGGGDEISETADTKRRNDDYVKCGYHLIVINQEWLDACKISLSAYIRSVLFNFEQSIRAKKRIAGVMV